MKHIKYEEYLDAGIAGPHRACPRRQHRFPTDRQCDCDTVYYSSAEQQLELSSTLQIYIPGAPGFVHTRLTVIERRSDLVFVRKISSLVQVGRVLVCLAGGLTSVF